MSDNEAPVRDRHVEFARAVVALAREHGVGKVSANFSLTGSRFFHAGKADYTEVRMTWNEGRHGSVGQIHLQAQASLGVDEKEGQQRS